PPPPPGVFLIIRLQSIYKTGVCGGMVVFFISERMGLAIGRGYKHIFFSVGEPCVFRHSVYFFY
ncbi:hypothetical protein ACVGWW_06765, partial [Enterobacter hormaechei]